ncbi:hypothetical protein SCWH03_39270 [Streptomyces pacificus]|uniref:Glutaredoxin domain-containing protein n=2 Tax=Streptomyces pacificus TaxID=2705029 RepID=A0A6A0B1I3_9ACTN|nr:hypothetical protein SCWH03_39270 [Streptomyces pacificus]
MAVVAQGAAVRGTADAGTGTVGAPARGMVAGPRAFTTRKPRGAPAPTCPEKRERDMQGTLTMYSTTWCGYCRRLKSQLDREGISYVEINIEEDPQSAAFVEKANNGNQTVPTVLAISPSGTESVMTNPSLAQVKQALAR